MPNNEVMNETVIETVDTATNEVAKVTVDKKGVIFVGLGIAAGVALTVGAKYGKKKIDEFSANRKAKKAAKKAEKAAEKTE